MKPILFTHVDLDGVNCALFHRVAYGRQARIEFCDYIDVDRRIRAVLADPANAKADIVITDLAPRAETTWMALDAHQGQAVILDHHETSRAMYERLGLERVEAHFSFKDARRAAEWGICGATLYWEYLQSLRNGISSTARAKLSLLRVLARLTAVWDLRQTSNDEFHDASMVNQLLYVLGREGFMARFNRYPVTNPIGSEARLLAYDNEQRARHFLETEAQLVHQGWGDKGFNGVTVRPGRVGEVISDEHAYVSDLGAYLIQRFNLDGLVIYSPRRGAASIRGREDSPFDCRAFAETLGGGGHLKSAGFPLKGRGLALFKRFMDHLAGETPAEQPCGTLETADSD